MDILKTNRGGKRNNAGRKPSSRTKTITIKISPLHLQWLKDQQHPYGKTVSNLINKEKNHIDAIQNGKPSLDINATYKKEQP